MSATETALGMMNHTGCDPVPQDIELTSPPVTEGPVTATVFTPVDPKVSGCPEPGVAKDVKDELTAILIWAEQNTDRSLQVHIGPSELGVECDRQLAYAIMGLVGPNLDMADPWPAFVGSAIHTRVEGSIVRYQDAHPMAPKWLIEELVRADPLIQGHADLNRDNLVVDVKSAGKTKMDEVKKHGAPHGNRVQGMIYAKGLRDAGKPIEYLALVYVPREGFLRNMYVWAERYDEALALKHIARPYELRDLLVRLDVPNHPERWEQVPASPSYIGCQYCPMYDKYLPGALGATDKGCPGYQPSKGK